MKKFAMFLFLLSSITFAQERMILKSNGEQIKLNHKKDLREAVTESKIKRNDGKIFKSQFISKQSNAAEYVDTLNYRRLDGDWNTNFGFFGQDVMLQWFEAPVDMTIKGIGFTCSDDAGADNATISLRLIRLNWTKEQLKNFSTDTQIGYFPSSADGMNNVDPFGEVATGDWVSTNEDNPLPPWTNNRAPGQNTFDYFLWEEWGFTFGIPPIASPSDAPIYQWIDIPNSSLYEVVVSKGEIFAVVATHDGINLDSDRIGFWSDATVGYPGWKYYENGRSGADVDPGWWVRMFTWDFAVAVSLVAPMPHIFVEQLTTTASTEARNVCAEIDIDYSYFNNIDSVKYELVYVVNDLDTNIVEMTSVDNFNYCGEISSQSVGTEIDYWVHVREKDNIIISSITYSFEYFKPEHDVLMVFNGYTKTTGYPQEYYFGRDTAYAAYFKYDSWAYGPLTKELVDNYNYIIENCTSGPRDYNKEVIANWFANDDLRVYMLWGDDWLGAQNGYTDVEYQSGDFEYDILGLTNSYNDVSYDGTSGQELPSKFMPQEGTVLGGPMFDLVARFNEVDSTKIDSVLYNPMYEIGLSNWHDGFEVRDDDRSFEVFMKAETRGIMGVPDVREVNVGISSQDFPNHFTVFMAYDPISIDSSPYYNWLGRGDVSSQVQAKINFPIIPSVDDNNLNNIKFNLSQNYPNPFNPSTTIKYSIPRSTEFYSVARTTLKIYDILGREVATLVNKQQQAGNYEVNFNANNLSSGIYFYKLQSGSFTKSMKMLLIK